MILIDLKVGDTVTRMLAATIPHELKVTALSDTLITCGSRTFDRATGAEIDDDLRWGPPPLGTGSFLRRQHGTKT